MLSIFQRFYTEIGLKVLVSSPVDVKNTLSTTPVRLLAYGGSTLILAVYLSYLGNSDEKIGLFMTLTLLGDVVSSLVLTIIADSIGRRRLLDLGSLLMTASGIVFATTTGS
jgi:MFS family permease